MQHPGPPPLGGRAKATAAKNAAAKSAAAAAAQRAAEAEAETRRQRRKGATKLGVLLQANGKPRARDLFP